VKKLQERYRYSLILLKQLVKTDFKLRYQGSMLGYVWSLLRPLALFVILYIVFTKFLKIGEGVPHYPIYLLLGIVLWNFFIEVTTGNVNAIVGKGDLIRKINFPKYVIVVAGSVSALINLALNFVVIGFFMALSHVDIRMSALLLPFIILELFVFALAVGFFLSAAFVRFRDVSYIWEVLMQGAFYATPILYPLTLVPLSAAKLLMINPMAQIIQDARYVLITPETQTISQVYGDQMIRAVPYGIVLATAVVAVWYFRSRSRFFAEEV
jgi:ABC-2 type transport system permease protein